MSGEDMALDFLEALRGDGRGSTPPSEAAKRGPRLATISAGYSGTGDPTVVFDGESSAGLRTYVALQPVAASQRVVMLPVGHTFVILGALGDVLKSIIADITADVATLFAADTALDGRLDTAETDLAAIVARANAAPWPFRVAAGKITNTADIAAGAGANRTVTFPTSRFTIAPIIVATPDLSSRLNAAVTAVSTTSATIRLDNFTSANAADSGVWWLAMQMTSSTAEG